MPYIVVGTGRCGTGTVARILNDKLGVFMGFSFINRENADGPDNSYEDAQFYSMNSHLIHGRINFNEWVFAAQKLIKQREALKKPWGFKDTIASYLLGSYIMFFDNLPRIIRCNRKPELVIKSLRNNLKLEKEDAKRIFDSSTIAMDRLLRHIDHLVIDFGDGGLSDNKIISIIKKKWRTI